MVRPVSSRVSGRRVALVELALALSLGGSILAVAVPAFTREVHASRFVEPVQGLERMGAAAVAYGETHCGSAGADSGGGFPPSAPMTPSAPPRGRCEVDPPDAWSEPGWRALDFRAAPAGTPHCFSFAFDHTPGAGADTFRAHAHGDLDGDGIRSTFEVTGRCTVGDAHGAELDPGMFVDSEVE